MSGEGDSRADRIRAAAQGAPLPKRFYKEVALAGEAPAIAVRLDGRPIRTPLKRHLALPSRPLAEGVAAEWESQGERIDPASMPLTRLSNTTIDRVAGEEARIIAEIVEYAGSDLVCYRAKEPQGLVEREAALWDPVLTRAGSRLAHPFIAVSGIVHHPQPQPTLAALGEHLGRHDAFTLTALHNMTTLTGSALLAMALQAGEIDAGQAWDAAHVDEDWQIEQWGADEEAQRRRAARRTEFDAAVAFLGLLRR